MVSYKVVRVPCETVQDIVERSPEGKHTTFLRTAHSLWYRFHNYEKNAPFALIIDSEVKALIFSTFNRDGYANLYEVVTVEGQGGHGYGDILWREWIKIAVHSGCKRLKISCTPESIGWHYSHGLIFWGVDSSGSLRSDQELFYTVEEQLAYREKAIRLPKEHLPPPKQVEKFKKEIYHASVQFGERKKKKITEAISKVGSAWLADHMYK